MAFKGGIPEKQFSECYPIFWNWSNNLVEDSLYGTREHPYFDDYWRSKIPALHKIECPAYIICSWGDHGIHTRGTLNAWKEISSKEKYLEIHQYQKWEWAVTPESLGRQKAFLDKYLLDHSQNEVHFWPKVRYTMRERYYSGEWRSAKAFPIESTEYTKFFPTRSGGLSRIAQGEAQSLSYDAQNGEISFDLPITDTTLEFAGHVKLRLWVEAQGAENMDLFITLRKVDGNGNQVFFPWITIIDSGPIGFGFMRVSRRELDEGKSKPYQPIHTHQRDLRLSDGEIVPVDIEIQPTSCRLRASERLQLFVSGHDYGTYPPGIPVPRHPNTVNRGKHVIHFGGQFDSHLLLPTIPPAPDSYSQNKKTVKMAVIATRILGDTDERFLHEYTGVHADMTRKIASQVPILRNYTQIIGIPRPKVDFMDTLATKSKLWDVTTILGFSTLKALWGSFQAPDYKASAGSHKFVDESTSVAILAQSVQDSLLDPISFESRDEGSAVEMVIFLARNGSSPSEEHLLSDISIRTAAVTEASRGSKLLRYVMNRSITPTDVDNLFAGTPFVTADWTTLVAFEQFWFAEMADAEAFLGNETVAHALRSLPESFDMERSIHFVGRECRVVEKDIGF
ncbi:CocE/NonD family hydrolase [Fusarium acuminatum]|uniref:CocE/NonD family hydrolase n=1 Tax=Fusarium acuminatum TaxID=5515 RepID=A0ABZ2WQ57_9HYPO